MARTGVLLTAALAIASTAASAQTAGSVAPPILPVDEELALAESAAPAAIARGAGVYVLTGDGYVRVRQSRNGFTCLVERSHPTSLEPICYDAEGSQMILPRVLEAASLRSSGATAVEIEQRIAAGFSSGRYRAPRRVGIAYMLSPHTIFFNEETGQLERGEPHLMMYAPYLTNADIGSPGEQSGFSPSMPIVIDEGGPTAYLVVFIDPADGDSALVSGDAALGGVQ